jgi:translation initiation factor IF-3
MEDRNGYSVGSKIRPIRVRVIAEDGTRLGVMTTVAALRRAADAGLDLVEIDPRATPPVCMIVNFEQFRRGLIRSPLAN